MCSLALFQDAWDLLFGVNHSILPYYYLMHFCLKPLLFKEALVLQFSVQGRSEESLVISSLEQISWELQHLSHPHAASLEVVVYWALLHTP